MILWNEQTPDFRYFPLSQLFVALPFTSALALISTHYDGVSVVTSTAVMRGIHAHLSQQNVEMGGLLLGRVFKDDAGVCAVNVECSVASDEFDGTGVSLRMGTAVWNKARDRQLDGQSIVGWYHSHPNFGVFFSGTDRRTQAAFFTQDHSLGLVVDPVRHEEMWFSGPRSVEVGADRILEL